MSESNKLKATSNLHCPSCGRSVGTGPNGVNTVLYLERAWCERCARIVLTSDGKVWVHEPSPGLMVEGSKIDLLDAWTDCYVMKPKWRIKVDEARCEIQRAWEMWNGDKEADQSMLIFYGWLWRSRPYFLTFRCSGDRWQRVHSWLLRCE